MSACEQGTVIPGIPGEDQVKKITFSPCEQCKKGTLIPEETDRAIDLVCSHCKRGWHIPLTPSHVSPCMDPRFSPPEPRARIRDPFEDYQDRDEKPDEEEG